MSAIEKTYHRLFLPITERLGVHTSISNLYKSYRKLSSEKYRDEKKLQVLASLCVKSDYIRERTLAKMRRDNKKVKKIAQFTRPELTTGDFDSETVFPWATDHLPNSIQDNDKAQNKVFCGMAALSTLDAISQSNTDQVYIIDINPSQLYYFKSIHDLVLESKTRAEFISKLIGKEKNQVSKVLYEADQISPDLHGISYRDINKEDKIREIEDQFWRCENIKNKFVFTGCSGTELRKYTPIEDSKGIKGVEFENLGQKTLGRSNITIGLSFIIPHHSIIEQPHTLAPLFKQNGFLSSEESYLALRSTLKNADLDYILSPITADLIHSIVDGYDGQKVRFWLSNVVDKSFLKRDYSKVVNTLIYYQLNDDYQVEVFEAVNSCGGERLLNSITTI